VIEVNSGQKLELRFDDLTTTRHNFGYTLVHCDASWKRSDISPQDYLTGFGKGEIRESSSSFNTFYEYIHYHLTFPEEECMPVLSGNYALVVYEDDDPGNIILTRRFYVTEKTVQASARLRQPPSGELWETGQQLEFSLQYNRNMISNPVTDLVVVVQQNNRDDNAITITRPSFVEPGRFEFADLSGAIFPGGNEFRSVDIKSMKYQTENIANIDFQNPYYHVYLKTDEDRSYKPYFSKPDFNGGYFIDESNQMINIRKQITSMFISGLNHQFCIHLKKSI